MAKPCSLYQTDTLTSISLTSNDANSNVLVVAQNDSLCVSTGNTIHLISQTGGLSHKQMTTYEFDSVIEVMSWSEDGTLLVTGDRSGVLHFVCPSLEKVLFSQDLIKRNLVTDVAAFVEIHFTKIGIEGLSELLVLGSDETVYIFQHINLEQLRTGLLQHNLEAMKQAQDGIKLSKLDLTAIHDVRASSILYINSLATSSFVSAGCGKAAICVWEFTDGTYNVTDTTSYILKGTGVTKCATTTDGCFLVTLTDSHTVAVWILSSLIMVNIWTADRVMDLSLLQSAVSSPTSANSCFDRLCLITEDASGQRSLSIVSLPGLSVIYSMAVSTAVTLCQGHVTEESLYFIESDDASEKPCVHLKHLVQALPEDRLSTLLAQGKFEEAEAFAQKFNLDPQLVYKSKARVLSELLCRATCEESLSLKDSLIECLEHVKDDSFVAGMALVSHFPTLETTLAVLKFTKNRLQSTRPKGADKTTRVKIFSALNKLTTFQMIHREDNFSPQTWQSFLEGSLLEELREYLQTGSLQQAGWIWNRHQPSLLHQLDTSNLLPLLQAIPESVPSHRLVPWVTENALPFILQHTPQLLSGFLSWIEQRIRLLELTEKDQWPSSALNMATSVLEAVQSFKNLAAKMAIQAPVTTTVDPTCDPNSPLAGLRALQERLGDLSYLHSNLKCSVSLSDYEKEPREVVVFRLFDAVVAAELVGSTIKSTVLPYIERHGLELDTVLLQYIKLLLAQAPRYSTGLSDTPWEAKTIALLHYIKDKELYLAGCAELLKHLQTPWSDSVEALVQECLKIQHPSVVLLQKQYKLLQLKRLLHGYGVRDFNFSNASRGMLYVRCILTHDGPKILEDALQVAEMYQLSTPQVYMHYILKLGLQDKAEDAIEVLRGLPREEKVAAAQEAFSCAYAKLQLSFSPELDEPKDYICTAKVAVACLKFLQEYLEGGTDCVISEDLVSVGENIDLLKRLLALQMEYSVFLTPQELSDKEQCRLMFETKVEEFLKYQKQDSQELLVVSFSTGRESGLVSKHYHDSIRFCQLLGYSEEQLFTAVASSCAESNQMDKARDICRALADRSTTPALATLLSLVVREGWRMLGDHPSSADQGEPLATRELAALAATVCHPDNLLVCVEQYQLCSLLCALHSQCEGGSNSGELREDTSSLLDRGIFSSWQWSPRFQEDGLVLNQCSLMSAAVEYIRTRLPVGVTSAWEKSVPFRPRLTAFRQGEIQQVLRVTSQVNQMLQDNGHSQLALQCILQTLGVYSLCTSLTGDPLSDKDSILQQGQTFVHKLLNNLINKSLSCRRIDHGYALALLLMVPPKEAIEKLHAMRSRSASSYSKVIALCKLAIDYGCLVGQTSVVELSKGILSSAEWGKKLSKYKVSFTEAFRGGGQEKAKVLLVLFRNRGIDLSLLFQYCRDFDLDIQPMLLSYLKVLLTEWKEGFQERAAMVIKNITNRIALHERLINLLTMKVAPYDYERIAFLLENLIGVEQAVRLKPEQGLLLLECLKRYCRMAPPSDYEKQWFAEHYCADQEQLSLMEITLPDFSKTRLPFHPLLYGTPMKVIKSELSKTTVGKLMPIAKILKLPPNDFFFSAIMSVVNESQDSPASVTTTQLPTPFAVFTDVAPLLDKIQDCSFALTVAKWLAKELHRNVDRLEALRAALVIARQWKEQAQSEDQLRAATERVEMFQRMLKLSQTEQLLQQHGLDKPEYLQLSNQGATLIIFLFTDIPVSKKQASPVHIIAAEIAHIYNLNLDKIKRNLLDQWLPATGSSKRDMDVTQVSMLEDPTDLEEGEEESEDQLNMKRLIYLMNVSENLEAHTLLLLNWAKRTSSSASPLSRVRALQILFAIAPPDLIERTSGTPIKEVRDYMQRALFVSELEALHMSTTLSAFQSCSKEGLVKSLWRNRAHEPRALRLICELCLYYKIFDASLWARLLEQLLTLRMLPYLRHVLTTLASYPGHWSISSMPGVWQKMLLTPFEEVVSPLMATQKQECEESLKMLYLCPFPFELDLDALVTAYCCVEMRVHALATVLMMPTLVERQKTVKVILSGLKRDQLISLLQELQDVDRSTYFNGVDELVYVHLSSTEQHETLLGSSHFTNYVHFVISRKLLDSLLIKTLQVNRMKEAIKLVELYNGCHQASQAKGIEALKEYMSVRELKGIKLEDLSEQ